MSCREEGCDRPVKVKSRQLCNLHYKRLQRSGPLVPVDTFAALIDRTGDCWVWRGRKEKGGYGRFGGHLAHRIAYERQFGPIPRPLTIDHRCRNRACVRPDHLRAIPQSANFSDNGWRDRTHCVNGHQWTADNTAMRVRHGRVHRVCRTCDRIRHRRASRVTRHSCS